MGNNTMKSKKSQQTSGERPSATFSREDVSLRMLAPWEYGQAADILSAAGLIADDLSGATVSMFGLYEGQKTVAVGGFERYGREALLRSMVVLPGLRNRGLGAVLLEKLESLLSAGGIDTLWLLTMTAEAFFQKHGYRRVERSRAPAAIRRTTQFHSLCPASAALMLKKRSPSDG